MIENLLKRGTKIGVVGKSGSGKSLHVDILAFALACQQEGSGDLMRKRALSRGLDLDVMSKQLTLEDDRIVDEQAIALLTDPNWTGILHGRVIRLLAEGLIKSHQLLRENYVNNTIVCSPEARASRALSKYRRKPGKEGYVVADVQYEQRARDANDFERLKVLYSVSHGLTREGHLYGAQGTLTQGIELNSELMTPRQELMTTLGVLHNLRKISDTGYAIGALRGLVKAVELGF